MKPALDNFAKVRRTNLALVFMLSARWPDVTPSLSHPQASPARICTAIENCVFFATNYLPIIGFKIPCCLPELFWFFFAAASRRCFHCAENDRSPETDLQDGLAIREAALIHAEGANQILVGSPRRGDLGRLGEPSLPSMPGCGVNLICALLPKFLSIRDSVGFRLRRFDELIYCHPDTSGQL